MITTVAELLTAFVETERKVLDKEYLKHGPTIGEMYENLSHDVFGRAIPVAGLEIVSGFTEDDEGNLSDELDCMLVIDKGKLVPRTTKYKVPIHAIFAIGQVKKTLYRSNVKDGFENLRSIFKLKPTKSQKPIPGLTRRSFQQIAQVPLPDDISTLPLRLQQLYYMLRIEAATPVRILLGYHGFKNERTFRTGIINLLKSLEKKKEKGWGQFPFPTSSLARVPLR